MRTSALPTFPQGQVEALAKVLGECGSGSDITPVLSDRGLLDESGESTKWSIPERRGWITRPARHCSCRTYGKRATLAPQFQICVRSFPHIHSAPFSASLTNYEPKGSSGWKEPGGGRDGRWSVLYATTQVLSYRMAHRVAHRAYFRHGFYMPIPLAKAHRATQCLTSSS
jgi:hypothetical protein